MKTSIIKKLTKILAIPLFISTTLHSGEPVKIMPLGDSLTYGNDYYNAPDEETQVAYRRSLWENLSDAGYTIDFIGSLQSGTKVNPPLNPPFDPDHQGDFGSTAAQIAASVYNDLSVNEPEVVLLHIGTNELSTDTAEVELALNEIDRYENDNNVQIQVILARIINRWVGWDDPDNTNRTTAQQVADTTTFNNNLQTMADARITAGDDIIVVDMETDSGIIYDSTDMVDDLHPNETGYAKMANIWFGALQTTLPTHLWKFDEPAGATTFIDTYRDNHGTCMGAACPQLTPGILGSNARLFDGNDEVTVSDDDTFDWSGSDSFTIEFWVKPTRTDGANQVIVGRENQAGDNYYWWAGIVGASGNITFRLRDSGGTAVNLDGPQLNVGEWYHVVCIRDGANDQNIMYVNGETVSTSATYAGNFAGTTPVNVGYLTFQGSDSFYLDSAVDELTVYNGVMNAAQANLHYERGIADSVLTISSTPTTLANVGSSYLYDVESTMDPSTTFTYMATPDLSWMNIDTDTGLISGTVTDEFIGNVDMSVEATNTPQTATQEYVLQIRDPDSLPSGMSHYWKLDETETTDTRTYIDSYGGADGTCTGGDAGCPEPRPGRINGAQSFDGSDMVDVTDTTGFDWTADASFTIEYWIRIDDGTDLSKNMVVIGRDGDSYTWWAGIQEDTGNAIFSLRSNSTDVSSVVSTSTIVGDTGIHAGGHHVAIVRDGAAGETRLYIDGNLTNTTPFTYTGDFMDSSASAVNIGYLNNNGTPNFFLNNGTSGVDDLTIFNRAMSAAEIQEHYDNSLVGNSFEALVDTTAPVITLLGSTQINVLQGSTYADAGATASDDVDGDITADIETINPVDTAILGQYTVTYNVSDSAGNAATEVTRTVNVVNASVDTTAPVITLLGSTQINVLQGSTYADAGATASDDVDGDITADIETVNPVDTAILGQYTVTYNVSDSAGNAATEVTRMVNVIAADDTGTDPDTVTDTVTDTAITSNSSGGGCTYNPNSNNFDMTFLLMVALGLFYPFRRRFLKSSSL